MKAYEALARFYDSLNGEVDYGGIADFYQAAFARAGLSPELVLDLGCGTGKMTLELARRGYDMIGVDGSAEMLSLAFSAKYAAGDTRTLFLQQDMRELELYGTVGAAVSTLDCINYLTEEGDLVRCFSLVHNYLDPGGIFLFDVNTPYKFKHVFGDQAYILEDETSFCGWQNEYDEASGLCRFYLSLFEEQRDGRYRRTEEEQVERCYQREELEAALRQVGFEDICFYGDTDFGAPHERTERWYISAICKK
ncbi:MAG: class I SAM-dependent methyltransferase [Ruminococcaceae bacterium]|nr:class I SAM-dependent methyltransferase [Oscillospiraceae bacterium]